MKINKCETKAHSLSSALSLFEENRKQMIRYLLHLDREIWRYKVDTNIWSIAQIVEHLNSVEKSWWFTFRFSKFLFRFLPAKPKSTGTLPFSPFEGEKFKKIWWFPSPKGNSRRKLYISEFDNATQRICYSCENLAPPLLSRMRFYSPLAGIVGITDAVLLLYYHDVHHFQKIQSIVNQQTNNQNGKTVV